MCVCVYTYIYIYMRIKELKHWRAHNGVVASLEFVTRGEAPSNKYI